ncbi:MAG: lipoyl synthase [Halobacteriovoraceae bacterium]|nr:lipoyl synthase [Halobacteriovoraceae bacterium]
MKDNLALKKPSWIKVAPPMGPGYLAIKEMTGKLGLATVCQEAHCPNIAECWEGGTATFMLLGDVCTRACGFCAVKTGNPHGKLDIDEPRKVGLAISKMRLDYVVLTSVDRDDLPDQGASHFARTVRVIKENNSSMLVEILTPDFRGDQSLLERLIDAAPDVFAHNMETVKRLTPKVRDRRAGYCQSLKVLDFVKKNTSRIFTKTSLMLGLGETRKEVIDCLGDLREVDCDIVTFGQYLRPTRFHLPVREYVSMKAFREYERTAKAMGFLYVAAGPLVRSSYKAGELFLKGVIAKKQTGMAAET